MKRIVISGAIALVLIASLGLASCTSAVEAKTGTIEVRVTDAPGDVQEILVTVAEDGVEVHKDIAGEGQWTPLTITGPNPFDLIKIKNQEQELVTQDVETAKYTQIRMTIVKVEVTYLEDGVPTTVEAKLPSGELKFVRPFDVVAGGTTILVIDFDADKSVVITGAGKVIFKPVVKLDIQQGGKPHQLATVEGTISAVDTEASTISIIPTGEIEAIVLDVNPQTEITLDGVGATLEDLAMGQSVTASYYIDNLKATQIVALSPPG